jgi:hypothetical protein
MPKTVFFSWQVDTPSKVGRGFLKDVLEEACKKLANETGITEAHRDLSVDSDTQGIAGQPPIVETIFKKIDVTGVFVADMTFTGTRIDKRPTPNPNVLIEYGWALKSLSHQRVICVMNDAYGKPSHESLPFDLGHVRWPIAYSLHEDATPETRKAEKQKLVSVLTSAIKASLETIPATPIEVLPSFPLAHAKNGPARFRGPNEALGFEYENMRGEKQKEIFLSHHPSAMWLRVMPMYDTGKRYPPHVVKEHISKGGQMNLTPIDNGAGGYGNFRAFDGTGIYRGKIQDKGATRIETGSVAFVFNTGEIWGVDTERLMYTGDTLEFLEDIFADNLWGYSNFLQILGIKPPFKWIAGITGVKGRTY